MTDDEIAKKAFQKVVEFHAKQRINGLGRASKEEKAKAKEIYDAEYQRLKQEQENKSTD